MSDTDMVSKDGTDGLVTVETQLKTDAGLWVRYRPETMLRQAGGNKIRELCDRSQAEAIIRDLETKILDAAISDRLDDAGAPLSWQECAEIAEAELAAKDAYLREINELLDAGQGDDDGAQILPDFEDGMSVLGKVEACLALLEDRRDVIEGFEADNAALTSEKQSMLNAMGDMANSNKKLKAKLDTYHEEYENRKEGYEKTIDSLEEKLSALEARETIISKLVKHVYALPDDAEFTGSAATWASRLALMLGEARAVLGGKPS